MMYLRRVDDRVWKNVFLPMPKIYTRNTRTSFEYILWRDRVGNNNIHVYNTRFPLCAI